MKLLHLKMKMTTPLENKVIQDFKLLIRQRNHALYNLMSHLLKKSTKGALLILLFVIYSLELFAIHFLIKTTIYVAQIYVHQPGHCKCIPPCPEIEDIQAFTICPQIQGTLASSIHLLI